MTVDIKAIREKAERATPGPWVARKATGATDGPASRLTDVLGPPGSAMWSGPESLLVLGTMHKPAEAVFAAAARSDVPALCDEVERLRALVWRYGSHDRLCLTLITAKAEDCDCGLCAAQRSCRDPERAS